MDIATRTALVTYALGRVGGTIDEAFALVDRAVAEVGVPTDDPSLRDVLREITAAEDAHLRALHGRG